MKRIIWLIFLGHLGCMPFASSPERLAPASSSSAPWRFTTPVPSQGFAYFVGVGEDFSLQRSEEKAKIDALLKAWEYFFGITGWRDYESLRTESLEKVKDYLFLTSQGVTTISVVKRHWEIEKRPKGPFFVGYDAHKPYYTQWVLLAVKVKKMTSEQYATLTKKLSDKKQQLIRKLLQRLSECNERAKNLESQCSRQNSQSHSRKAGSNEMWKQLQEDLDAFREEFGE